MGCQAMAGGCLGEQLFTHQQTLLLLLLLVCQRLLLLLAAGLRKPCLLVTRAALTLWLHPWLPLSPLLLPSSGQRGWLSEAGSFEQMSLLLLQQHLILGNLTYGSCFPPLELSYHGCQVCL